MFERDQYIADIKTEQNYRAVCAKQIDFEHFYSADGGGPWNIFALETPVARSTKFSILRDYTE